MNEQGPQVKNSTPVAIKPENRKIKRSLDRRRYSDSEDSDCGLVIDLDRRLSVEERGDYYNFLNLSLDYFNDLKTSLAHFMIF